MKQRIVVHQETNTRYAVYPQSIKNLTTKEIIPPSSTMARRIRRFLQDKPTKELQKRFAFEEK